MLLALYPLAEEIAGSSLYHINRGVCDSSKDDSYGTTNPDQRDRQLVAVSGEKISSLRWQKRTSGCALCSTPFFQFLLADQWSLKVARPILKYSI